ncbi:MAG: GtrA family protein [Gammaproteobacteria bacterium]|nr:GtrA family protein [Gammaproteobacteria bacterium]
MRTGNGNSGLPYQLVRFLMVGAISFVVDAGVLGLLVYQADVGYIASRLISVMLAISVAFVLNARFTFLVRVADARFMRYVCIQAVSAGLNFGVYSTLVLHGPLAGRPLLSLICGAAVATVNNFFLSRRFVYVRKPGDRA